MTQPLVADDLIEIELLAREYAAAIAADEEIVSSHDVALARHNAMERAEGAFRKHCTPARILSLVAGARKGVELEASLANVVAFSGPVTLVTTSGPPMRGGCNCYFKAPTVPVYRDTMTHLDDCPAKGSGFSVGALMVTAKPEVPRG